MNHLFTDGHIVLFEVPITTLGPLQTQITIGTRYYWRFYNDHTNTYYGPFATILSACKSYEETVKKIASGEFTFPKSNIIKIDFKNKRLLTLS